MIAQPKSAIDPRSERSRQVILQAVLDELSESGYGALTIKSVARRAGVGVGKATIYWHWSDKIALIANAFNLLRQQRDPELVNGTPREKLERVLRHVANVVANSPFSSCLPALIEGAERDRAVRRFHHHFQAEARQPIIASIAHGVAMGDFPSHINPTIAAFALLGAIFCCRLMTNTPFSEKRVPDLIDTRIRSV